MNSTLLLRLTGPTQSWGVQSRFTIRDTLKEPSKSGVIGLLCAALGRRREADISDLAALRLGVRVEREGQIRTDYHTVQGVLKAGVDLDKVRRKGASTNDLQPVVSYRHYLADAWFVVGLEGSASILEMIHEKLKKPERALALGRLAFPPGLPVHFPDGAVDKPLEIALAESEDPWWKHIGGVPPKPSRLIIEGQVEVPGWRTVATPSRPDQPLSFRPRRFTLRTVSVLVPQRS